MSIESVAEVVYKKRQRGRLSRYWSTMGFIFQIVRDIDPKLRIMIDTFTLLGLVYTGRMAIGLMIAAVRGFRVHLWSRVWTLDLKRKYGEWAVITGATDGIGLEYARALAGRGFSLILVGRNESKLAVVKQELLARTQVVTIVADLNSDDPELYDRIAGEIDGLNRDIGILVNNAGVMYDSPNRFMDQPVDKVWQHIRVNIAAVLMMTRTVLPGMIRRRRGLVINMSSIAAYKPLPLMGVYSASKVFVEWFSKTLEIEYKSYNIDVQTLTPSYIATKMTEFSDLLQKPSIMFPSAETFAANAIATIGRTSHTTGYWCHSLQHFLTNWFVPDWVYTMSSWHFLKSIDNSKTK
ncbi:inactive hydroxysteroid dehydrogenase-like protein 1 [Oppia nitens]|uniref:inactive hydroxysteroid dehydrogenase-like protein 1 n=1 Tax=Oppia nitens TaxID=1686743 RepID=UPI0023D979A4|nr:inactive hydroxysteroid dehydrogenase-like protein 1 [Oppia nitens]